MPRLLRSFVVAAVAALVVVLGAPGPAPVQGAALGSTAVLPPTPQQKLASVNSALAAFDSKLASDLVGLQQARDTAARAIAATTRAGIRMNQLRARSAAITGVLRQRAVEAYVGTADSDTLVASIVGGSRAESAVSTGRVGAELGSETDAALVRQLTAEKAAVRSQQARLAELRQAADRRTLQLDDEVRAVAQVRNELALQAVQLQSVIASLAPTGTGTGGLALCTTGGITVACSISQQLSAMLGAARSDGVVLTGSGYRNPAQQIALRAAHCGTSTFDVYGAPPSSCSPPTARPGSSQHEIGLAIDFDDCNTHATACWQWLSGHAAQFGFHNLPVEPWHWSTTGH